MVHRHLGSARITYPTGVQVSPADPMTTANLPQELLRVPGVVSRPIRLSAAPLTANQLIQQYLAQAGGDPLMAFGQASAARRTDPQNLELRNAEHALFSTYLKHWLGPGFGHAAVAVTPAYSALKAVGRPLGFFKRATPPSWREVQYGLQPLLSPTPVAVAPVPAAPTPAPIVVAPTVTGYVTVGSWPGAMTATAAQCQAYLSTHGGAGYCQAAYSNGTLGPLIPYTPPPVGLSGVGYYPNLGQDAGAASYLPAGLSGIPGWVWYLTVGGAAYVILYALFFRGGGAPAKPRVRTVTRTTY